jgi:hypothetical protein
MTTHPPTPCPKEVRRRFWVQIPGSLFYRDGKNLGFLERLARQNARTNLIRSGFLQDRFTHNMIHKTCLYDKIIGDFKLAKAILGGNGGDLAGLEITTQPLCRQCGALSRFSSKACPDCSSRNIESVGRYDTARGKIVFEKREEAR